MNHTHCLGLVALLATGSWICRAETPASPTDAAAGSFLTVQEKLEKSGGSLTPEVRSAYVDWAEQTVLEMLKNDRQEVPADCLAEVDADPVLRDAMFAAIDPPDPSILRNYADLRSALGPQLMSKYRSLVIATAVAARMNGAHAGKGISVAPQQNTAPEPGDADAVETESERLVDAVAGFMTKNKVPALDLYKDAAGKQQLEAFLQAQKFDAALVARIDNSGHFQGILKQAMIKLGQRPAHREQSPDTAAWLRYLVSVVEAKPSSSPLQHNGMPAPWPRFPIDKAPWPLLMPLSRAYPLGEARYIWEKYQGEHGNDRYHTYGPYRDGEDERVRELVPSAWYWSAWPDILVHGGICTVMAPMAVETHVTLGEPAFMAGQPGHSNLMSYRHSGDFWYAVIEQAFAGGPTVTWGSWLFNEEKIAPGLSEQNNRAWALSEYQLGLALAMNTGLHEYIDTRIAVNLFLRLPDADKAALGAKLLTQATQTNPFNPAPWELLARQTTDAAAGLTLAKLTLAKSNIGKDTKIDADDKPPGTPPQNPVEVADPKSVSECIRDYWKVVVPRIVKEAILSHPLPPDNAAVQGIYDFLQPLAFITPAEKMPYRVRLDGTESVAADLKTIIQSHLESKKVDNNKKREKKFAGELNAFLKTLDEDTKKSFLADLKAPFPPTATDDPYLLLIDKAGAKSN